jgi:5-(carboxyamino)imidazole ribonucleotide synthase
MDRTTAIERVGAIGGGQLAWMMASAARGLGLQLAVQTPKATDPAAPDAAEVILAAVDDAEATARLAASCQVITFENEFVDLPALSRLEARGVCFRPALSVLAPLLDKYQQRCHLQKMGLPVPAFTVLETDPKEPGAIATPAENPLGWPAVIKARRHGYDGQGTAIAADAAALDRIWHQWGRPSVVLEQFVPFERELAVVAARSPSGAIAIYPVVETQQERQVCRRVLIPGDLSEAVTHKCEAIARQLLESLDAVGVFGIELFLEPNGQVSVNEIAPRTHNSGHLTIDACETSQFEQHLRAVCDRPLGSTALTGVGAVMVNLLGYEDSQSDYTEKRRQLAAVEGARVYWYGKNQSRPGRKLGHVTVVLTDTSSPSLREQSLAIARQLESIWYPS